MTLADRVCSARRRRGLHRHRASRTRARRPSMPHNRRAPERLQRRARSHADDRAPAGLEHVRQSGLRDDDRSTQIETELLFEAGSSGTSCTRPGASKPPTRLTSPVRGASVSSAAARNGDVHPVGVEYMRPERASGRPAVRHGQALLRRSRAPRRASPHQAAPMPVTAAPNPPVPPVMRASFCGIADVRGPLYLR